MDLSVEVHRVRRPAQGRTFSYLLPLLVALVSFVVAPSLLSLPCVAS